MSSLPQTCSRDHLWWPESTRSLTMHMYSSRSDASLWFSTCMCGNSKCWTWVNTQWLSPWQQSLVISQRQVKHRVHYDVSNPGLVLTTSVNGSPVLSLVHTHVTTCEMGQIVLESTFKNKNRRSPNICVLLCLLASWRHRWGKVLLCVVVDCLRQHHVLLG